MAERSSGKPSPARYALAVVAVLAILFAGNKILGARRAAGLWDQGVAALNDQRYDEAIRRFEEARDSGRGHPGIARDFDAHMAEAYYKRGLERADQIDPAARRTGAEDLERAAEHREKTRSDATFTPSFDAPQAYYEAGRTWFSAYGADPAKPAADRAASKRNAESAARLAPPGSEMAQRAQRLAQIGEKK